MKELSLHILDIVQNSLHAGADKIEVEVYENIAKNSFIITIIDNGCGISKEKIVNLLDPFYTTKNKKTGLGIPLLKQHTEMAGGNFSIESKPGTGTQICATFEHNHLDRQPMGDIAKTISGLICANPQIRFIYTHQVNTEKFVLDTDEIKNELEGLSINSKEVVNFIEDYIRENLNAIST